jgi:hypothetical protein
MRHKKEQLFKRSLMLLALSFLSSCATANCEFSELPVFPKAGAKVADELENLSFEEYPNLWEWIARLNKMRKELEIYKPTN